MNNLLFLRTSFKCATSCEVELFPLMNAIIGSSDAQDAVDLWRHHHARADREETHPLHGDPLQTAPTPAEVPGEAPSSGEDRGPAPGPQSVQAGDCSGPAGLGEERWAQKDPSPPLSNTKDCILGHCHLTVTTHLLLPATQPLINPSFICVVSILPCNIGGGRTTNKSTRGG